MTTKSKVIRIDSNDDDDVAAIHDRYLKIYVSKNFLFRKKKKKKYSFLLITE